MTYTDAEKERIFNYFRPLFSEMILDDQAGQFWDRMEGGEYKERFMALLQRATTQIEEGK